MRSRPRHPGRTLPAVVALAIAAGVGTARADGVTASVQAYALNTDTTLTDASGRTSTSNSWTFPQRYRLAIDKQFAPMVLLNANGVYEWTPGFGTTDGASTTFDNQRWSVFGSVVLGPPVLNLAPYYGRRQEFSSFGTDGVSVSTPTFVNQYYGVYGGWNPAGLPTVSLRAGRNEDFDTARSIRDRRNDEVVGTLTYNDVENLLLRYGLRWARTQDLLTGLVTSDLNQAGQVVWSGSFLDRTLTTSVNYALSGRSTSVVASGGGTVSLPQFPVAGLSLVETFPAIPGQDTLAPNPALIDGDTLANAGVDIGFAPALAGDQNFRDLGVQFANTATPVSAIWVWVDRQLPASVWGTYSFTAWQSSDNVVWTQVPIVGPVVFATFDNRFEIPIARTEARYLKVVTKPLTPAVTNDPRYAAVFVTEVQAYLVTSAAEAQSSTSQLAGAFNGSLRWLFWRDWNLAYTFAVSAAHQSDIVPRDWNVLNSVSASRPLSRSVALAAQVERADSAQTNLPHQAQNRWSAQLSYTPIPGVAGSLTYSGLLSQLELGTILSNSLTFTGSLAPYQGVNLFGTVSYSWTENQLGQALNGLNGAVGFTIIPMSALTINATYSVSTALPAGNVAPVALGQVTTQLQANVSFTPVPALIFNAGVTRTTGSDQGPQTLANFSAGFSPFAGGQLILRFGYDEWLDSQARSRNRLFGPSVRWNIRAGTYVDVAYTWNDTIQPALLSQSRSFFANLTINFM